MIELLARRRLERVDLAALRVDAGHDVLDRAVLAGGVHRLEDQQHRPAILRVEHRLHLAQRADADLQGFLRLRLALGGEASGIGRVNALQPEALAIRDPVGT